MKARHAFHSAARNEFGESLITYGQYEKHLNSVILPSSRASIIHQHRYDYIRDQYEPPHRTVILLSHLYGLKHGPDRKPVPIMPPLALARVITRTDRVLLKLTAERCMAVIGISILNISVPTTYPPGPSHSAATH